MRRTRPGLVPRAAPRGYADHLGTDAPRKPRRTPTPTPHTHSPVSGALLLLPSLLYITFEGTFEGTKVSFWVAASVYQILLLTNNGVRRLSVLWKTTVQRDVLIVALGVHVVAVLTRTPLVNEETTPRRFWRRGSGRRS